MRRLLLILIVTPLLAQTGVMRVQRRAISAPSFAFVSAISVYATAPASTAGYTTTAGAALAVTVGYSGVCGSSVWSVSSTIGGLSSGDTFAITSGGKTGSTYGCSAIFTAFGVHAATGNYVITASTNGGESVLGVSVLQVTGPTAVDQVGNAYGSTTTMTSSSMTVTGSPEIIVSGGVEYTSSYTVTQGAGYTIPANATASDSGQGKITSEYKVANPASGAYAPVFTWSANDAFAMSSVTLK